MLAWRVKHAGSQHRGKEEASSREDVQLHAINQAAYLRRAIRRVEDIDPRPPCPMNSRHVNLRVSWTSTNSEGKHGDVHLYDGGLNIR